MSDLNDTKDTNVDTHFDILCPMCNEQMTPTHQCCETDIIQPISNHDEDVLQPSGLTLFGIPIHNQARLTEKFVEIGRKTIEEDARLARAGII